MTKEDAAKAILKKLGIVHTKKKQSVVKIIEQFYEDEASIENARMRDEVNNAIKALELIKQEADDALDILQ
jgi:hypothetical protein